MGILAKYYIIRYQHWFEEMGFIQHRILKVFDTPYDHMYLYFTEVIGLGKEIAISIIDEYRVEEVLQTVRCR